jgi:hypothetical protein
MAGRSFNAVEEGANTVIEEAKHFEGAIKGAAFDVYHAAGNKLLEGANAVVEGANTVVEGAKHFGGAIKEAAIDVYHAD